MTTVTLASARRRLSLPRVDVLRVLLTVLALVPYVAGWSAGWVVSAAWWTWAALVAGWRDARRGGG
jgi:hypothetical protein